MNVTKALTTGYENKRPPSRAENKPNQTRSGFIPKGAQIPTGELLRILKPGTNFKLFAGDVIPRILCSVTVCPIRDPGNKFSLFFIIFRFFEFCCNKIGSFAYLYIENNRQGYPKAIESISIGMVLFN